MTRVSEIIKKLQSLMDKHGDVPIVIDDTKRGYYPQVDIDGIDFVHFEPDSVYDTESTRRVDAILVSV